MSTAFKLQAVALQGFLTSDLEEYHSPGWGAASNHAATQAADVLEEPMDALLQPPPHRGPALEEEPAYEAEAGAGARLDRMELLLQAAFEPEAAVPRAATADQVGSS